MIKQPLKNSEIEAATSQFGLQLKSNEPKHIQGKSTLILHYSYLHLLIKFGGGFEYPLYLDQNCNHQIIFATFNLKVHYSPTYEHEV